MNRYILIRRLRGPAFLLLIGVIALLNQADILSWGHAWPLFLILAGVLALAERAALATGDDPSPLSGGPYAGVPYPGAPAATPPAPGTAIVPAPPENGHTNGGQS